MSDVRSDVRTFRAATMHEALNLVRNEMGSDAVILHTRQVAERRLLPWRKAKQAVEITAGLGINIRPGNSAPRPAIKPNPKRKSAERKSAEPTLMELIEQRFPGSGVEVEISSPLNKPPATLPKSEIQQPRMETPEVESPRVNSDRVNSARVEIPKVRHNPPGEYSLEPLPEKSLENSDITTTLNRKLDSIQRMLEGLKELQHREQTREIPNELFPLYAELIDAEIAEDVARDVIHDLHGQFPDADVNTLKTRLENYFTENIPCSGPIRITPGQRKIVALVGPTGVGKTTTIAKLAANFRLRDGIRMGLVTVDTYRIAAVEQLRTYAEIIDLPMKVVTNSLEMRRALDELQGLDLILIDTAGRSPRDELKIQELKSLLTEARVDEVHLVLSTTSSLRHLEQTVEQFRTAHVSSLLLTKLDEAMGPGIVYSISRRTGLPLSYLTTGQDVPDDIEEAKPQKITTRLLTKQ